VKFLIIGGCGFLGHRVVLNLLDRGHEVAVVDDFSTSELNPDTGEAFHRYHDASYHFPHELPNLLQGVNRIGQFGIRHPLERERGLYTNAFRSFVSKTVELVDLALTRREPLDKVVVGGISSTEYRLARRTDPALLLQRSLISALEFYHVPGSLSVEFLLLPELVGVDRQTPIVDGARSTAPVDVAAAFITQRLLGKACKEMLHSLPSEYLDEV